MFEPETNQGFENVEEKQANSPSLIINGNIQFNGSSTKLTFGTIQSLNYEKNVRGWCLFADGNVDFPGI